MDSYNAIRKIVKIRWRLKLHHSISIIGLGYVGLPLALAFAKRHFKVVGIDLDSDKLAMLRQGTSYLTDVPDCMIEKAITEEELFVTDDYRYIASTSAVIVCVPTPLAPDGIPDLSCLHQATARIGRFVTEGMLVVLESSTYPGTTREVFMPMLEQQGFVVGRDVYAAYSPERIDPGNRQYGLENVPKIVSGLTESCTRRAAELYAAVFQHIVTVSSTETAEMAKLLENTYRFINISFINEFAILCDAMQINVWEVIDAARTKPYGFSAFYPGPGVGGHCIPVDPLYLQWKLLEHGAGSEFIRIAEQTNHSMPRYIVSRLQGLWPESGVTKRRILLAGVAYKQGITDTRESAALELMTLLRAEGAEVSYYDPFVPSLRMDAEEERSVLLNEHVLHHMDCVVIATDHAELPLALILEHAPLVYDTRNATKGLSGKARIIGLGAGDRLE
ncbi:nucleotide sugar dehydrogenase [Paenibacillaceae bacterium]|nr:nucleotide sugar dehydrogenase [Paenibacillaceae bacterium]